MSLKNTCLLPEIPRFQAIRFPPRTICSTLSITSALSRPPRRTLRSRNHSISNRMQNAAPANGGGNTNNDGGQAAAPEQPADSAQAIDNSQSEVNGGESDQNDGEDNSRQESKPRRQRTRRPRPNVVAVESDAAVVPTEPALRLSPRRPKQRHQKNPVAPPDNPDEDKPNPLNLKSLAFLQTTARRKTIRSLLRPAEFNRP